MVHQKHSGPGDNVLNKYESIIRSIKAGDLLIVAASIMQDICYRDPNKAHEKLNVLNGIGALEVEVQLLLKALMIKVELVNTSDLPSKNDLLKLLNSDGLPNDICDVVTSILIDLESRSSTDLARLRYTDLSFEGVYCKEVFYEFLASEKELKDAYQNAKVYNFSEQELTGLVRGALRVEDFKFAFELAKCLHEYFLSSNSAALLLYTKTCFLCISNQQKHYVSISYKKKCDINKTIDQILEEKANKFNDPRYIASLANLLNVTDFSNSRLFKLGKTHLNKIRNISLESANNIEKILRGEAGSEESFKFTSDKLDIEQFILLDKELKNSSIKVGTLKKWLSNEGGIITKYEYFNSFCSLYLNAWACSDKPKEVDALEKQSKQFLDIHAKSILNISSNIVTCLCEKLIAHDLSIQAIKYLEPFLPKEAWVSPVLHCYIDALFYSEKFDLLLSKVSHLNKEDKTAHIYLREAMVYERLSDFSSSIIAIRSLIEIQPYMPYAWQLLLHVSREHGASQEQLSGIVFEIPETIFSSYHESCVPLVNEIAIYTDLKFADRVLVDWFAQNPDQSAIALTQVHFNSFRNRPEANTNSYEPLYCCDGVKYSDGFDTFSRLLVRDISTDHSLLLDIESPLGKKLNAMKEGEMLDEITLIERLPPFVAAFRYASAIRHKGNDGTDAFKIFTLPSSKEDYIPYLENILRRYSPSENRSNEILSNPNLTFMMKAHYTNGDNLLRGAVMSLCSCETNKYLKLFNRGEKKCKSVILDVYTAVYLSLMGFVPSFIKLDIKIVLCRETKKAIESWIEDVSRDNYMTMGVSERGLYRVTSEDFQRDSYDLIEGLKVLLVNSRVESLKPSDTPEFLTRLKSFVDETVYSTFQLSFANEIPLLCIDYLMAGAAYESGLAVVDMDIIVKKSIDTMSLKDKKKGIEYNLYLGTPCPIYYNDIIMLSCSSELDENRLVSKFLDKYGDQIISGDSPLNFLARISTNIALTAYLSGEIAHEGITSPKYHGYAVKVFNSCCRLAMNVSFGHTSEQRLAIFFCGVIYYANQSQPLVKFASYLLSEFFFGHFLDIKVFQQELDKFLNTKNTN